MAIKPHHPPVVPQHVSRKVPLGIPRAYIILSVSAPPQTDIQNGHPVGHPRGHPVGHPPHKKNVPRRGHPKSDGLSKEFRYPHFYRLRLACC
jgi:hypothetical protein